MIAMRDYRDRLVGVLIHVLISHSYFVNSYSLSDFHYYRTQVYVCNTSSKSSIRLIPFYIKFYIKD